MAKSGKQYHVACRERCVDSLGKLPTEIIDLGYGPVFDHLVPPTMWKMIIYDFEILHELLREAIPQFLRFGDQYDFFSVYKKEYREGELKVFLAPRIFKSHVKLLRGGVLPENVEDLESTIILNGWLLDQDVAGLYDADRLRIPQSRPIAKDNVGNA
jgi:hypothetical protein